MKPIPNLFLPHEDNNNRVTKIVNPECDWVTSGSGQARRYYEGTFYMFQRDHLYRHCEVKLSGTFPKVFMLTFTDTEKGIVYGWEGIAKGDEDYEILKYLEPSDAGIFVFKEGVLHDINKTQAYNSFPKVARTYDGLSHWIKNLNIDGVLFKNPDCRMALVTRNQLGL